jgi:hypothetical protein
MTQNLDGLELDGLADVWEIKLTTGDSLRVLAHGFEEENGVRRYSLMFKGKPHVLIKVLEIPKSLIIDQWEIARASHRVSEGFSDDDKKGDGR